MNKRIKECITLLYDHCLHCYSQYPRKFNICLSVLSSERFPHVCVGFKWVFWFPPIYQKHAKRCIDGNMALGLQLPPYNFALGSPLVNSGLVQQTDFILKP